VEINKQAYSEVASLPEFVKYNDKHPPAIRSTDKVTIFFTKEFPLSNFYSCNLIIDDLNYNSVEQYICHQKALLFDDAEVAAEILSMDDPNALKQRAKHLTRFDQDSWKDRVGVLLKAGLNAKFTQNDHLKAAPIYR
jgi:ribA/ribD-fused uncharacterized protein